jgi:methionine-rich copper-binding protein CopC
MLWAILAAPGATGAHAIVLESSPAHDAQLTAAPDRVVLRFNSKIEHGLSRATIEAVASIAGSGVSSSAGSTVSRAASGRPVALATEGAAQGARLPPDRLVIPLRSLVPGTYVVRYRVLAADGHLTEGALRFTIRAAP